MNLKSFILTNEKCQAQKTCIIQVHLQEISGKSHAIITHLEAESYEEKLTIKTHKPFQVTEIF